MRHTSSALGPRFAFALSWLLAACGSDEPPAGSVPDAAGDDASIAAPDGSTGGGDASIDGGGDASVDDDRDASVDAGEVVPVPATELGYASDPAFGSGGRLELEVDPFMSNAVAVQPDGKILLAGATRASVGADRDAAILRLLADGSIDMSFGTQGIASIAVDPTDDEALRSVHVAADGRIVAGGEITRPGTPNTLDIFAVRFDASGAPDATFGTGGAFVHDDGILSTFHGDTATLGDGSVFLAGKDGNSQLFVLVRLTPAGVLDTAFNGEGFRRYTMAVNNATNIAVSSDEASVFLGANAGGGGVVLKVSATTSDPDVAYGSDGSATISLPGELRIEAIGLQADGALVFAGSATEAADGGVRGPSVLGRLLPDGSLDTDFASGGFAMSEPALGATDEFAAVAVRSDGKIVAAGDTVANSLVTLRMARFTSMGELDATFGGDGVVEDDGFRNINALALTPDDGCVFTVTSAPPHVPYVFRLLP